MADAHKNFAYSTVATAPSPASSGTSLVVAAGGEALFPAVPFNATVWPAAVQPLSTNAEVVRVTGITTDTLTIVRTQESSSARSIVVGDQIAATITAQTLTDAEAAQATTLATDTLWAAKGDIVVASANDAAGVLTVGAEGTVLASRAGMPKWVPRARGVWPVVSGYAETFPPFLAGVSGAATATAKLYLALIRLEEGDVVTNIGWLSGSTALSGGSHAWVALYNSSRHLLRQSTDDTSPSWAANALWTKALSSPYTVTASNLYYIGLMIAATTVPTLCGTASLSTVTPMAALSPIPRGQTSDVNLTTTAPTDAGAITVSQYSGYGYVS